MEPDGMLIARILTVSDGVASGNREDISGRELQGLLESNGWLVDKRLVVEDGSGPVAQTLRALSNEFHGLIVTTGGTGFGPRDQTPEGTKNVIEREAPGLAEAMRLTNPLGRLSRGIAGTLGTALIVNVPGSSKGSVECMNAVLDVVGHAVRLLVDNADPHPTNQSR
ncbi:MAG: MogA/MoaB family molybdenum cofactor biosynthesis protein [Acidimicrobiales bacterium]|nr:MogA/MoaB family molybdenum cofactor biosynthesis protein [Acidimicrobiales bacterium]MDG1844771.1 MogA/MoaB family molybdenum cofactor biosynthesis protein [Acidimicrobiales bacterium]